MQWLGCQSARPGPALSAADPQATLGPTWVGEARPQDALHNPLRGRSPEAFHPWLSRGPAVGLGLPAGADAGGCAASPERGDGRNRIRSPHLAEQSAARLRGRARQRRSTRGSREVLEMRRVGWTWGACVALAGTGEEQDTLLNQLHSAGRYQKCSARGSREGQTRLGDLPGGRTRAARSPERRDRKVRCPAGCSGNSFALLDDVSAPGEQCSRDHGDGVQSDHAYAARRLHAMALRARRSPAWRANPNRRARRSCSSTRGIRGASFKVHASCHRKREGPNPLLPRVAPEDVEQLQRTRSKRALRREWTAGATRSPTPPSRRTQDSIDPRRAATIQSLEGIQRVSCARR